MPPPAASQAVTWLTEQDCDLDDFRALVEQVTELRDYPAARAVEQNVLVYDACLLRGRAEDAEGRLAVQAELARVLLEGPGVVVVEHAFEPSIVDRATQVFRTLLDEERATGKDRGDYFAKPGTNERLWDSLGKLAFRDPEVFVDYFANDMVALVSVAWLGPATRSRRRSTWSTQVARPRRCTATITWALRPTSVLPLSLLMSTNSLRYSHFRAP